MLILAPIFQFVEKFDNDIPHSGSIRSGLDNWSIFWTDHFTGNRPDSISSTSKIIDEHAFSNIYAILNILAVYTDYDLFLREKYFYPSKA